MGRENAWSLTLVVHWLDLRDVVNARLVCRKWSRLLSRKHIKRWLYSINPPDVVPWWLNLSGAREYLELSCYNELLLPEDADRENGLEGMIARDVIRTFPTNSFFKSPNGDGQKRLFDALYAVSTHYQDIGYCQGMNYIAAVLILIGNESSAAIKPDEFAFWIMKTFIERHDLRTLWKPGLPGLRLRVFQFERLVAFHLPAVYHHLKKIELKIDFFATQWFMTLYARLLPVRVIIHLWSIFFVDGWKLLLRVGLALLRELEPQLVQMDLEECSVYFRRNRQMGLEHLSPIDLMTKAHVFKITRRELNELVDQYKIECLQGRLDEGNNTAEIQHIRSELGTIEARIADDAIILRQKIEQAEKRVTEMMGRYFVARFEAIEAVTLVEDVLEMKERLQTQYHEFLMHVMDSCHEKDRPSGLFACFVHESVPIVTKDQQVYEMKLQNAIERVSEAQCQAQVASRVFVVAQMELEEAIEYKTCVCDQLKQIVAETEEHKVQSMTQLFAELDRHQK